MSVTLDGVKFIRKPKKGIILLIILGLIEFVLTIILVISLSANILFPEKSKAALGVSKILSYQGRLTDANGNPLGGSGTNYCFRFSIYNAPTGGNKLWPSGTPSNNVVNVVNGVFNVGIGEVDDLSTFDFSSNDTVYLNVEVAPYSGSCGTYESLSPRQRIDAIAYAREAFDLYGGEVRVGTGTGVSPGSQKLLKLDVVNAAETIGGSCTVNGALWYNSNNGRALVCDNGTIQEIGNKGTIVGIKEQSASSAITSGTVNFSALENITISQEGQTLKFKGPAGGGGGGATFSNFQWPPGQATTLAAFSNAYMSFQPISFDQNVTATRAMIMGSVGLSTVTNNSTAAGSISVSIGLYTRNGSTLYSVSSGSALHTFTNSSNANVVSISGLRRISVPININATPGEYWYMVWIRTSSSVYSHNISLVQGASITQAFSGNLGAATNSSRQPVIGQGIYSNTSTAPGSVMSSVAISDIKAGGTAGWARMPWILFTNYDLN